MNTNTNKSHNNHHKSMGLLVFPIKFFILLVRMKTISLQALKIMMGTT